LYLFTKFNMTPRKSKQVIIAFKKKKNVTGIYKNGTLPMKKSIQNIHSLSVCFMIAANFVTALTL